MADNDRKREEFACNCLNVIIEKKNNERELEILRLDKETLSKRELEESFFKHVYQVNKKDIRVNISVSGLIQKKEIGSWNVFFCLNCETNTHAVEKQKTATKAVLLFNNKLLKTDAIERLRNTEWYSKTYKLIVKIGALDDEMIHNIRFCSYEIELVVKSIKDVASDVLILETKAVKERIREFSDRENEKLNAFREKTLSEQQSLVRVLLSHVELQEIHGEDSKKPSSHTKVNEPKALLKPRSNKPSRLRPKRKKNDIPILLDACLEFEGLENVESTDENTSPEESDTEEEDVSKIEDLPSQPPKGGGAAAIAKSLPMDMPVFLSRPRTSSGDMDENAVEELDDRDIAASMKALAKSVHGESIFDDIPRPRYSSYI